LQNWKRKPAIKRYWPLRSLENSVDRPSAKTPPVRLVGSGHPRLTLDAAKKISRGRNAAAHNGADMPFAGDARGNRAGAVFGDDDAKPPLRLYMDRSTEERFRRKFVRARDSIGGKQ
jgi:hypothetical protein